MCIDNLTRLWKCLSKIPGNECSHLYILICWRLIWWHTRCWGPQCPLRRCPRRAAVRWAKRWRRGWPVSRAAEERCHFRFDRWSCSGGGSRSPRRQSSGFFRRSLHVNPSNFGKPLNFTISNQMTALPFRNIGSHPLTICNASLNRSIPGDAGCTHRSCNHNFCARRARPTWLSVWTSINKKERRGLSCVISSSGTGSGSRNLDPI